MKCVDQSHSRVRKRIACRITCGTENMSNESRALRKPPVFPRKTGNCSLRFRNVSRSLCLIPAWSEGSRLKFAFHSKRRASTEMLRAISAFQSESRDECFVCCSSTSSEPHSRNESMIGAMSANGLEQGCRVNPPRDVFRLLLLRAIQAVQFVWKTCCIIWGLSYNYPSRICQSALLRFTV